MLKKKLLTDRTGLLQEKMFEDAAKKMAEDIDAEVLMDLLVDSGWHKVVLTPMTWETGAEIDLWVEQTITGKHWNRGLVWLFEDSKDANWFSMRWLSVQ